MPHGRRLGAGQRRRARVRPLIHAYLSPPYLHAISLTCSPYSSLDVTNHITLYVFRSCSVWLLGFPACCSLLQSSSIAFRPSLSLDIAYIAFSTFPTLLAALMFCSTSVLWLNRLAHMYTIQR